MLSAAETPPPAGGAGFDEILIAAGIAGVVIAAVGWEVLRERQGHTTLVGRLADKISEYDGLPRWVGLPMYLTIISLLTAGFGVWWDVPIHMQNGRDEGPLANPAHYPIFLGILGFAHAGILSLGLARDPLPRRTFRLTRSWRVPYGALVIVAAGQIALAGFPADDVWHRIFGQDVTEWGPTHVMMIGGAVTCVLGIPLLLAEAHQVGAEGTRSRLGRWRGFLLLALCVIPMAFLMEFDLGVPQYPAATQFIIAGFLMGWIFCAARMWFGPGGALGAALVYLVVHGLLYASIAVLPGVLEGRFLLFLPAAVLVELVALAASPQRRPVAFGMASGVAVGTLGLFLEWVWSHWFMPLPQPFAAEALPWLLGTGTAAAVGGGLLAGWHVARLRDVAEDSELGLATSTNGTADRAGWGRWNGLLGVGILAALMVAFAPPSAGSDDVDGTVSLSNSCDGTERCLATVTVRFEPADAVKDAAWFYALAWQGRGNGGDDPSLPTDPESGESGIMRVAMEPTGEPGEYRSADPLPLYGNWKTLLRVHHAPTTLVALPLHAPEDPAIEGSRGEQILATDGQTVALASEKQFLQREVKEGTPGWLNATAYAAVIGSWLALVLFFGWCYASAAGRGSSAERPQRAGSPVG